jgi:glutamyl-tRNA reductase
VRLAAAQGAIVAPYAELTTLLSTVDVVVCATASPAPVITDVPDRDTPLLILDLAIPRDVAPGVGDLPHVNLVDLERLGAAAPVHTDVTAAEDIVAAEIDAFLTWQRGSDVAPTVAALRARADDVVAAELKRLRTRLPHLGDDERAQVAQSVHRVVQRLLHEPTIRVRQRAAEPGGEAYAQLLRDLFDLQPEPVDVPGALSADVSVEVER